MDAHGSKKRGGVSMDTPRFKIGGCTPPLTFSSSSPALVSIGEGPKRLTVRRGGAENGL